MSESVPVTVYVSEEQRDEWREKAEEMDMSLSEFVEAMTNAGQKKFELNVDPDETNAKLREDRNYFERKLKEERREKERLEEQLHGGERQAIANFIEANQGVSYQEIVEHVADTVPSRVSDHLEAMNGESIWNGRDGYYPLDTDEEEA